MISLFTGTLLLLSAVSITLNVILLLYSRRVLVRVFNASEELSSLFTRMDAYKEHLESVYEMPVFYGDTTLKSLLDHSSDMIDNLKRYEDVYSFTQPDLLEQLASATEEMEGSDEEETPQERQ
jgi:hypothetical protein